MFSVTVVSLIVASCVLTPGYGLSIESAPYAGTTVTIRTPRVPEDREGEYDKTH